jgi:TusA-related sulfurtransferase
MEFKWKRCLVALLCPPRSAVVVSASWYCTFPVSLQAGEKVIIHEAQSCRLVTDAPHVVLDAGDDSSVSLSSALYRCVSEMLGGQVLEVICQDPRSRIEIPHWCSLAGHQLLRVQEDQNKTFFWIRKE